MVSGLATTLLTVAMVYVDTKTVAGGIFKYLGHYVALCAVMIVLGGRFGWINLNVRGIALMMGAVAAVYVLAFGAYYIIDLRSAKQINQRLKEKYGDEQ